jgi:hypothetical protein
MVDQRDTSQTTEGPEADNFWGGLWWVPFKDDGFPRLRSASPSECAEEIKRLRTIIQAAREELEEGGGGECEAYLILKHALDNQP